jgi:hypothetical protein
VREGAGGGEGVREGEECLFFLLQKFIVSAFFITKVSSLPLVSLEKCVVSTL